MRRVLVSSVDQPVLPPAQAHHLLHVLRLEDGTALEVFDTQGNVAPARLSVRHGQAALHLTGPSRQPPRGMPRWQIASAVPKGDRADWLVEKLSELGASGWIPLRTDRSVVHPEGAGKMGRWQRIAAEAAEQSRRTGVLHITPLQSVHELVESFMPAQGWVFSTERPGIRLGHALEGASLSSTPPATLQLLIGPEGGWSPRELQLFEQHQLQFVTLGPTILRIETAAIAASALLSQTLMIQQETV